MDFDLGEPAAALRVRLRALIAAHIAEDYLGAFTNDPADLDVAQRFCKTLADEGLLTLAWPTEYGGGGGSVWDQTVVREEMWAHHEPRGAQYMGLNWVGPAIMAFGTDAQKAAAPLGHRRRRRDLVPGLQRARGRLRPGLAPHPGRRGRRRLAHHRPEDLDLLRRHGPVVRAGRPGRARASATRASRCSSSRWTRPGITVRPIRSMLGPHHLNEVFFDDVWAGPDAVLGGIGEGWAVIRKALAHERVGIARYARCERLLSALGQELAPHWDDLPASLHTQWARALVQVRVARLLAYRTVHAQATGEFPDVLASSARIAVTQCDQAVAEVLFQAVEHEARRGGHRARRSTAPSRTTGATPRPPPSRRAPSRCSA